ncbi:MAG: PilZ domain-containing protein [Candidatus Omnitrophota bacterium]
MKEKRRFIRFETAVKINYILQKEPKIEKTAKTKNVNTGGLQLITDEKLDAGSKVELKIFVPDGLNPVHMNGVVLWSKGDDKPFNSGIEFGKVEEDNKNTFLKFLCELMYKK